MTALPALLGGVDATARPGTGSALLAALYNLGGGGAAAASTNPVQALRQAERTRERDIAATAARPEVKRDIAAFRAALLSAADAGRFLSDPRALKVLLTANGMAEHVAHAALARKALLSDTANPDALANRLSDPRWKSVAETFRFARAGLTVLRDPAVRQRVEDAYAEVVWRRALDERTPGLSDALDFRERAGTIRSALQVLGDPVLRRVVTTALGVPREIAFQSLEAQQLAITTRLDLSQFADPRFVDRFVQRFLIAAAGTASGTVPGLLV